METRLMFICKACQRACRVSGYQWIYYADYLTFARKRHLAEWYGLQIGESKCPPCSEIVIS